MVIALPDSHEIEFRERILQAGPFRPGAHGWEIEYQNQRVYLSRCDAVAAELDTENLIRIRQVLARPIFYVLDYTDVELCREALRSLSKQPNLLIDTDHGQLVTGEQLAWRLRADPAWDWRRS